MTSREDLTWTRSERDSFLFERPVFVKPDQFETTYNHMAFVHFDRLRVAVGLAKAEESRLSRQYLEEHVSNQNQESMTAYAEALQTMRRFAAARLLLRQSATGAAALRLLENHGRKKLLIVGRGPDNQIMPHPEKNQNLYVAFPSSSFERDREARLALVSEDPVMLWNPDLVARTRSGIEVGSEAMLGANAVALTKFSHDAPELGLERIGSLESHVLRPIVEELGGVPPDGPFTEQAFDAALHDVRRGGIPPEPTRQVATAELALLTEFSNILRAALRYLHLQETRIPLVQAATPDVRNILEQRITTGRTIIAELRNMLTARLQTVVGTATHLDAVTPEEHRAMIAKYRGRAADAAYKYLPKFEQLFNCLHPSNRTGEYTNLTIAAYAIEDASEAGLGELSSRAGFLAGEMRNFMHESLERMDR